jgi:hypothetical protein
VQIEAVHDGSLWVQSVLVGKDVANLQKLLQRGPLPWWRTRAVFRPAPELIGGPFKVGPEWMEAVWRRLSEYRSPRHQWAVLLADAEAGREEARHGT